MSHPRQGSGDGAGVLGMALVGVFLVCMCGGGCEWAPLGAGIGIGVWGLLSIATFVLTCIGLATIFNK